MVCTFFGHHDAPPEIRAELIACIREGIEQKGLDTFYVGNQGAFDRMVLSALRELKRQYPEITYYVVLAYFPDKKEKSSGYNPLETMYPEGLECVPRRFAISRRNDWMLKEADAVICYVRHSFGGSGKFAEKGIRQGKTVVNLAVHSDG